MEDPMATLDFSHSQYLSELNWDGRSVWTYLENPPFPPTNEGSSGMVFHSGPYRISFGGSGFTSDAAARPVSGVINNIVAGLEYGPEISGVEWTISDISLSAVRARQYAHLPDDLALKELLAGNDTILGG